jgi:chromosome segregation ATPase
MSNDSSELKRLETKLKTMDNRRKTLNSSLYNMQQESSNLKKQIGEINTQISKIKNKKDTFIISEHAMLRYIERIIGIDLTELQEKIIPSADINGIKAMGDCTVKRDGFSIVIKDNTVVTVID